MGKSSWSWQHAHSHAPKFKSHFPYIRMYALTNVTTLRMRLTLILNLFIFFLIKVLWKQKDVAVVLGLWKQLTSTSYLEKNVLPKLACRNQSQQLITRPDHPYRADDRYW